MRQPITPKFGSTEIETSLLSFLKFHPTPRTTVTDATDATSIDKEPTGGVKFDQDKPRMELIDSYAAEQLALVLTFGAKKYAANNWRKGISVSRLIAAAFRHLFALLKGEDVDQETGLSHAAHAMCCCMFLIWTMKNKPEFDDRYKETSGE